MDAHTLDLINSAAEHHALPPTLVRAIVMVESGGHSDVQRYEPAFYTRYIEGKPYKSFGLSHLSEGYQRATSYGLMQVMGEVARELGLTSPSIEKALCDPATCLDYGCKLLAKLADKYQSRPDKWPAVCAAYNGGPGAVRGVGIYDNPKYPAKVAYQLTLLGVRMDDTWSALNGRN